MAGGARTVRIGPEAARTLEVMLDATAAQVQMVQSLERALEEARAALGYQRRANGRFVKAHCGNDTLADLEGKRAMLEAW